MQAENVMRSPETIAEGTSAAYFWPMLRPAQCRAARALLGWSQQKLAEEADVPTMVLNRFERGKSDPRTSTRDKIEQTLRAAGIELLENDRVGVALRSS